MSSSSLGGEGKQPKTVEITKTHGRSALRLQRQRLLDDLREAEISNLDAPVVRLAHEQKVLRLKVPVRHASIVTEHDGLQEYFARHPRLLFVVVALLYDPVEQLPAGQFLHDEVERLRLVEEVVEAGYVRAVLERAEYLHLVLQREDVLLLQLRPIDDFYGVLRLRVAPVLAALHSGKRPRAELANARARIQLVGARMNWVVLSKFHLDRASFLPRRTVCIVP